ncbi:MAG: NAD-dependent epimerase/dehydratase family protein [Myxococcota bacterium]|nr:NAD-dependent epimerase/dehydratase family protein [Myxococcota bacterium]
MKALVIGGTGPTGPFIVGGLRARGYSVAILHTGNHEVKEIPEDVEHIHVDPWDVTALARALSDRSFDLCVAAYGRLRSIAELMKGRCDRFISLGGGPSYLGYMNPGILSPPGMPVPVPESAARVVESKDDAKGMRIALTEDAVFESFPDATHFRYPIVYGPRQPMPREWSIVRRILDGRRQIILPDGGLTLCHCGYAENLAEAILLAVDKPERASGRIYNCGDSQVLTLAQTVEVIAEALGHAFETVSMPYALAKPTRPMVMQPLTTHRVYDLSRLCADLGYRDVVPVREAVARTARHLAENPPARGGVEERVLQDPFDYPAEDRLIAAWHSLLEAFPDIHFESPPGYTLAYSGPGGRTPSSAIFE